ncbi:MAG TPA: hypothetical protein VGL35_11550 [Rhizomicrobium sp.]|jgi:hypothetical protein
MVESEELFALSALERLDRYRELATEAARLSAAARTPDIRTGYHTISQHWAEIAAFLERAMRLKGFASIPEWEPPCGLGAPRVC